MKLSELLGLPKITADDIKKTEEYAQVRDHAGEEASVLACRMQLRGSVKRAVDSADLAGRQLTAFGAMRKLAERAPLLSWVPSGPGGNNAFVRLIDGDSDTFPFDVPSTTVNCWEVILLAVMLDGQITGTHNLRVAYGERPHNFEAELTTRLMGGVLLPYTGRTVGTPIAGDIVLFDGLAHVAMATGVHTEGPMISPEHPTGAQVISFWPAPLQKSFGPGARTTVGYTTIEALLAWHDDNNRPRPAVTFGSPDWSILN
ncbi:MULTISPECIES: hypothetical protein [Saccharothrix]|uniref:hypothetical protein n=1 Tax=Saccharothrix TaxID=2071 RepID=UPI00095F3238|nr:hypothetical protein [Saccharothrix sp. CB00851]OKI31941.1 hypothetical protein A6A25_26165 [Saccharothrix sp. CB00851]